MHEAGARVRAVPGRGVLVRITSRVTALVLADRVDAPGDAARGEDADVATHGHIVLGDAGQVELWSRATRALVRRFFAEPVREPRRLPRALEAPLARLLGLPPGPDGRPAAVGQVMSWRRGAGELRCRVLQHPRSGRLLLHVELEPAPVV
jgi:hypothetical protein